MSHPNPDLIEALRQTARRLESGQPYKWSHMGSCNCGHLAQTMTKVPAREIHRVALEKAGDWGEQARAYCPTSGLPMDHILTTMLAVGLSRDDLWHLERLSDPRVTQRLPAGRRNLDKRRRDDAVLYMRAWADLLEENWMKAVTSGVDFEGILNAVSDQTL